MERWRARFRSRLFPSSEGEKKEKNQETSKREREENGLSKMRFEFFIFCFFGADLLRKISLLSLSPSFSSKQQNRGPLPAPCPRLEFPETPRQVPHRSSRPASRPAQPATQLPRVHALQRRRPRERAQVRRELHGKVVDEGDCPEAR